MKSFWKLILLTLVLVSLGADVNAAGISDHQEYNAGLIAMKNGNFREALQHLTKATESNPNEYKYFNDRGVAFKRLGDLDKALEDYNKSLEINPHYTNSLNNRGVVYLEQGRYDDALADFQEALKYGGLEGKIFTNIGIAKAAKGDHRSAIKDFDNAVSLHPVDPRSFLFMGQSLEHLGDKDKALKMYQVALGVIKEPEIIALVEKKIAALDPHSSGSLLPVAPAEASRNESERISKNNHPPSGKPPTAASKRSREIVLANKHPNYIEEIVKANTQRPIQTNLPEALETFNRQIRDKMTGQLGPASAEILRQGTEFVEKSDDHKAMVRFEDIRQLERRNKNYRAVGWALLEIGRIYIRRGDYLKAEEAIDNSLKIFSTVKAQDEKILALIELARLKRIEKSNEKALAIFTQAREQADLLGRPTLSQGIQDMVDGSFDQRKSTTKPIDVQTKIQPEKGPIKEPAQLSKALSQQTIQDEASKVSIISSKTVPKMSSGAVRSVFDTKPEKGLQREKESIQSSASASLIDNKVTSKSTKRIDETKTGVESPTAKHPDTTKPISVAASSRPETKQVVSKKDVEKSIKEDLLELRSLRKQNDEAKMAVVLERLSRKYSDAGDYEKALNAVNIALTFREKLSIYDGRANALQFRGLVHEKLGKPTEALEDLTWSQFLSKNSNKTIRTKTKYLAGKLGLNVDAALSNYETLWLAREAGDTQGEIKSLLELGKMYARTEHFEEASKYYELSNVSLMAERSVFYQKLGKLDQAKKTMEQALQTLRSLDYLLYFSFMNRSRYHDKLSAIQ